jgi:predicted acylesterase/phospholipase RssA
MKALFEGAAPVLGGRPLRASVFTGTSVGAYNAAFLAQADDPGLDTVLRLQEIWRERIAETMASCGNGVYRLRLDPRRPFEPGCWSQPLANLAGLGRDTAFWAGYALLYGSQLFRSEGPLPVRALETFNLAALFSREPLESLLRDTIDFGRLRASANELAVVASDWQNGVARVFNKTDLTDRLGEGAILASAAIPGIFPPVELDGTSFVDGALLMNTPLKPAILCGANVLHVIYVDPHVSEIPFPPLPNTLDTLYRIYNIVLATQINGDVHTAATVNEEMAALGTTEADSDDLPVVRARRLVRIPSPGVRRHLYRPLAIHRYRPRTDLGGVEGLLNFRQGYVNDLIAQGYEDTVRHDCDDSQCVLPPPVLTRAQARPGRATLEKTA